jgi:hypothetical protein
VAIRFPLAIARNDFRFVPFFFFETQMMNSVSQEVEQEWILNVASQSGRSSHEQFGTGQGTRHSKFISQARKSDNETESSL